MIHAEWVEMKKKEFSEQKLTPMKKISNNFIDNTINKNNLNAIKTIFYLATVLDNFNFDKEMDSLEIDLKKMFKYTNITAQEARNNLRAMQETSITFINEEKKWELHIVLIPRIEFFYGQNRIEIDLYSKIAKLIVEVKDNYTYVNTKVFW